MKSIPYYERVVEALAPLNPQRMTEYDGDDITQYEKIETEMMTQYLKVFKADKLKKITTITSEIMGGKIM
jgi:hypothetical protein